MKTFALLLALLLASPALSQPMQHTSSLDPGSSSDFQRSYGGEEGGATTRALKRALRRDLLDVGLRGTYRRMHHLGAGVARLLGIASDPETPAAHGSGRRVTCRWEADPFDLSLTLDLIHRHGVATNVEVDLNDRRIALEVGGRHRVNYGLAYEDEGNTLQALVTVPF